MARALVKEIKDTRKNYLINGDMRISQRKTLFTSIANATYCLDRFAYFKSGAMVHSIAQDTDVPTVAQAGYLFQNSLLSTVTTVDTSIAATDYCQVQQKIEGYNWANLAQKICTVSFWVKSSQTGTYCVALTNSGNDRSCVQEYTINSTNTWEYKTVVFPASPSAGTWNYTNGIGVSVQWCLASGTNFQTTAGAWQTGNFFATSNQVNATNTIVTSWAMTGACINEGSAALPFTLFGTDFGGEVRACQRYYEKSYDLNSDPQSVTTSSYWWRPMVTDWHHTVAFKATKRAAPSSTTYSPATGAVNAIRSTDGAVDRAASVQNITNHGLSIYSNTNTVGQLTTAHWTADAEL